MSGQRIDRERRLGDQRQRAFAADEQPGQVELAVDEHVVEPVAAAIDEALRPVVVDRACVATDQARRRNGRARASRRRGRRSTRASPLCDWSIDRMAADAVARAVGQHDLQLFDVPPGRAVARPVAAAGVDGHDAAHRGDVAHRGIGAEQPAAAASSGSAIASTTPGCTRTRSPSSATMRRK